MVILARRHKIAMVYSTDYGRPVRKSPSLHGQKSTPNPKFLGTAEAYFVGHIGQNFHISLIYTFMGCPMSVVIPLSMLNQGLLNILLRNIWLNLMESKNTISHFIPQCRSPLRPFPLDVFLLEVPSIRAVGIGIGIGRGGGNPPPDFFRYRIKSYCIK